ncbi:MAG: ribulose-phosphate 3-epimerase [Candidatus Omnitrophica bacterium]|nr:ribulose-phosphate 3-epimerase [Candidatus Omnitrophota bacterium]
MIVPALLTDQKDKLIEMTEICSEFTDYVQVDIMDGVFVPSRSITIKDLKGVKFPVRSEAHLMVSDPLAWLDVFRKIGAEKIIYHFEIGGDQQALISKIKEEGFKVGVALNPPTNIDELKPILSDIDSVLFMSVNPGFYGANFIPEVLEKVKSFKSANQNIKIGIDGGIKLSNVKAAKEAGVDDICVGSAILKSDFPKKAYEEFVNVAYG